MSRVTSANRLTKVATVLSGGVGLALFTVAFAPNSYFLAGAAMVVGCLITAIAVSREKP